MNKGIPGPKPIHKPSQGFPRSATLAKVTSGIGEGAIFDERSHFWPEICLLTFARVLPLVILLSLLAISGCTAESTPPIDAIPPTPELTATPTPEDTAQAVVQQAAQLVCPSFEGSSVLDVYLNDPVYGFTCTPAAGHWTTVRMERLAGPVEARAALDAAREDNPLQEFHGFAASVWQEQHPSFPDGRNEYLVWAWQAGRWFIHVRAFDDTHYLTAPDPETVSEAIYQVATECGLFPVPDK